MIGSNYEFPGTVIFTPKYSEWVCHVAGAAYRPCEGKQPNWFHRKMQELAFGVRWVKDTPA